MLENSDTLAVRRPGDDFQFSDERSRSQEVSLPPPSSKWGANGAPEAHSTNSSRHHHLKLAGLLSRLLSGIAEGWGLLKVKGL